jgi:hypothetical protein
LHNLLLSLPRNWLWIFCNVPGRFLFASVGFLIPRGDWMVLFAGSKRLKRISLRTLVVKPRCPAGDDRRAEPVLRRMLGESRRGFAWLLAQ